MTPPAATAAPTRTLPRRSPRPRAPRRVSGPAPRPKTGASTGARRAGASANDPFITRALQRGQSLSDSRFLDRLIRGRLWIPLVAAGLMGIVFMQVSMLKLNAGIGRAVQASSTLERQNATMRSNVSRLESGTRIDTVADELGMVVPADGSSQYVDASAKNLAATAAKRMTAAAPEAILRSKAATQQLAATGAAAGTTGALGSTGTAGAAVAGTATTAATPTTAAPTATTAATGTGATGATTTSGTGTAAPATGTASTTGTTGTASTPSAVAQPPAATTNTGAAAAPTQQTPTPTAIQPQQSTSGGAVAPAQG
jgi:hypothetical protein